MGSLWSADNRGKVNHRTASVGQEIELPSGFIRLKAGEYQADISAVVPKLETKVRALEAELEAFFQTVAPDTPRSEADMLVKMVFRMGLENGAEPTS